MGVKIRGLFTIVLFLIVTWSISAGAAQRIELMDGTVLQGKVLSFDGSSYEIATPGLGTVRVEASKVRNIRMDGASPGGEKAGDLRSRVLMNPEAMGMIMGLQNDPDMQEVLQDQDAMDAVQAGDLERLISNPKFMRLLQNPRIQEIVKGALK